MLTDFDKYNAEMKQFEEFPLFLGCYHRLMRIFQRNKGNTVTSDELEKHLCISGAEVRKLINHARKSLEPIGSGQKGYFYASTLKEIEPTIKHLEERANAIYHVAACLKKCFQDNNQTELSL